LGLLLSSPLGAAEPSPQWSESPYAMTVSAVDAQELYLEVSLNAVPAEGLVRFVKRDDRLWISGGDLRGLGLRWDGDAAASVALDSIVDLRVNYDAQAQRISLMAPVALLDRPVTQLRGSSRLGEQVLEAGAPLRGLTYNYDVYAQHDDSQYQLNAWQELRLNGLGPGVWSSTLVSRGTGGGDDAGFSHDDVRLDSSWSLDFPKSMLSLAVGDSLTGALSWSRFTRIGGIRLSRNFALQPYRVTAPLVLFQGEATLPSTVDIYINGLRQSSQSVLPGQFESASAPILNGVGQAQMVITDINGQQRSVELPLYGAQRMLQTGMTDFSVELGAVRLGYGIDSFDYSDDLMFSGTWRYGLSDRTTVETHAESTSGLQLLGGGGSLKLGKQAGVLNLALAGSNYAGEAGTQVGLGYQWNSRVFNISFNSLRREREYRDVASLNGTPLPRGNDQAYIGTNTPWGNLGVGYVRQDYFEGSSSRFVNLSWFRSTMSFGSFSFNAVMDMESDMGATYTLSYSLPLGRRTQLASSARHNANRAVLSTSVMRAPPVDSGGWGWRVEAAAGDSQAVRGQVSHLGNHGQWLAGFMKQDSGGTYSYAGLNGGLLWTGPSIWAMRKADDSFTLVSTGGMAGVPVLLENRPVGATNSHGYLLVNRLNSYQRNHVSIDTAQLPANMRVSEVAQDVVPARRSGVLTNFALERMVTAQGTVRDAKGEYLPAGSALYLSAAEGERVVVVGYDGFVYMENPPPGAEFHAGTAAGECHGHLPAQLSEEEVLQDIGVLICE
jgi:outer membrane usher protein